MRPHAYESGLNSVAEVLEKHGLQKPISYVKNSQNSEEEAHQLMVKLCRHTGRRYGHKRVKGKVFFFFICCTVSQLSAQRSSCQ